MFYQSVPKLQQSTTQMQGRLSMPIELGASAGGWHLEGSHALTLKPTRDGVMRVVRGRVWATLSGPHGNHPDDSGDVVLVKGEALRVPSHQRLVIEPWQRCATDPVYFSWEPLGASV